MNTQPADFESWSTRTQIHHAMRSLSTNLQAALQTCRKAVHVGRGAVEDAASLRKIPLRDISAYARGSSQITRRVYSLYQKLGAARSPETSANLAGDPHFLVFCSVIAEIVLSV